jgi:hypothetical protein
MFHNTPSKRMFQNPSYSINLSGMVCVGVCGVSAAHLRHVSMDADGYNYLRHFLSIFQVLDRTGILAKYSTSFFDDFQ